MLVVPIWFALVVTVFATGSASCGSRICHPPPYFGRTEWFLVSYISKRYCWLFAPMRVVTLNGSTCPPHYVVPTVEETLAHG